MTGWHQSCPVCLLLQLFIERPPCVRHWGQTGEPTPSPPMAPVCMAVQLSRGRQTLSHDPWMNEEGCTQIGRKFQRAESKETWPRLELDRSFCVMFKIEHIWTQCTHDFHLLEVSSWALCVHGAYEHRAERVWMNQGASGSLSVRKHWVSPALRLSLLLIITWFCDSLLVKKGIQKVS